MIARLLLLPAVAAAATSAYLDNFGHVMIRTSLAAYPATTRRAAELSLSADGRLLLFTRDEEGTARSVLVCDTHTRRSRVLVSGEVRSGHFAPGGDRVAFLKYSGQNWQLWVTPLDDAQKAVPVYRESLEGFAGWSADGSALLAFDANAVLWISPEGRVLRAVPRAEIYGAQLQRMSSDRIRLHPSQPDVLLLTAYFAEAPRNAPVDESGNFSGVFTYDLRAKKLQPVTGPDFYGTSGEWSAAGDRILLTRREPSGRTAIYQTPWRGAGFSRIASGSGMVESGAAEPFAGFFVFSSRGSSLQLCAGPEVQVRAAAELEQSLRAAHAQFAASAGGGIFVAGTGIRTTDGGLAVTALREVRARRSTDCQ